MWFISGRNVVMSSPIGCWLALMCRCPTDFGHASVCGVWRRPSGMFPGADPRCPGHVRSLRTDTRAPLARNAPSVHQTRPGRRPRSVGSECRHRPSGSSHELSHRELGHPAALLGPPCPPLPPFGQILANPLEGHLRQGYTRRPALCQRLQARFNCCFSLLTFALIDERDPCAVTGLMLKTGVAHFRPAVCRPIGREEQEQATRLENSLHFGEKHLGLRDQHGCFLRLPESSFTAAKPSSPETPTRPQRGWRA